MLPHHGRGWLMLAFLSLSRNVPAAQWEISGSLGQTILYNDNISFGTLGKTPVFGYLLNPVVKASRKTPTLELAMSGQGDIRRYDDSHWNCDNYNFTMDSRYIAQRNTFALRGRYNSACSYIQQLGDTGRLVPNTQYENYDIAPSWAWRWSPRGQVIAEASYSKTSYSNGNNGTTSVAGFSGNDTYSLRLGGSYEVNRRLSINGGLVFSDIQYTESTTSSQTLFGFQLGGNYAISRKWRVSLGGGLRWVDTQERPGASGSKNSTMALGNTANISVSYEDRLSRFSIGYSNSVNPSAIGELLQYHTAFANYSYCFAKHLSVDFSTTFNHNESIGQASADNFGRDYFGGSMNFNWEFYKDWNFRAGYVYRWQKSNTEPASESNLVMVSINYAWDGFRFANR